VLLAGGKIIYRAAHGQHWNWPFELGDVYTWTPICFQGTRTSFFSTSFLRHDDLSAFGSSMDLVLVSTSFWSWCCCAGSVTDVTSQLPKFLCLIVHPFQTRMANVAAFANAFDYRISMCLYILVISGGADYGSIGSTFVTKRRSMRRSKMSSAAEYDALACR
jgi:hypothetical protein